VRGTRAPPGVIEPSPDYRGYASPAGLPPTLYQPHDPVMETHRFPPPWIVTEYRGTCFIVKDANGQKLGTFYFRVDPGTARQAGTLTRDEAHSVATDFAKLPGLLKGDQQMQSIEEAERLLRRLGRR
jgi:hypothetical protein